MNPGVFAGLLAVLLAGARASRTAPVTPAPGSSIVAILMWLSAGPAWVIQLVTLSRALDAGAGSDAAIAGAWVVMLTIVLFPWPIARRLLIPLGCPKLAWAITRLSWWVWRGDSRGGALVAASWAAIRRRQRRGRGLADLSNDDAALVAWIDARRSAGRFTTTMWRVGSARIVAQGLLAELRGDRVGARRLLASALELAEPARPPYAVKLALDWLCAEAIERGAWRDVEFLARTASCPSRRSRLFGCVAARVTGIAPLPTDARLIVEWARAPSRRAHLPLLRQALASRSTIDPRSANPRSSTLEPPIESHDSLTDALALHAFTLVRDPLSRDDLAKLGGAWDRALADPQLERRLVERGDALGLQPGQAVEPIADLVRDDLLALVRAAGFELGSLVETSELLDRAARRLHTELLDGIETTVGALEGRVKAKRQLPPIDEWQGFLALREQYADAVAIGGLELRRLGFQAVHSPTCALAVWLWNDRTERALANAMFQWLLAEAIVVDDAEAIRLQEKNVDCGV